MIEPGKINTLEPGQKRRKLALTFGALERDIQGIAEKGTEYNFTSMSRAEYVKKITEVLLPIKLGKDSLRLLIIFS